MQSVPLVHLGTPPKRQAFISLLFSALISIPSSVAMEQIQGSISAAHAMAKRGPKQGLRWDNHKGWQPTGVRGLATTEDGAYCLNGATTNKELIAMAREADTT